MPQLDVKLEPSSRNSSEAIQLYITNQTDLFLLGSVSVGDNVVNLWPFKPGFTSRVALGTLSLGKGGTQAVFHLRSEVDPDLSIDEEITLPTDTFPCFEIEISRSGVRVTKGVQVAFDAGSPELQPLVWAIDTKGKRHPLRWGRIVDGASGLARECYVAGGLKSLEVTGVWAHGGKDHEIADLTLDVDDSDCGVFRIVRSLVPTAEEIAEKKRLEKEKEKQLAKEAAEIEASIAAAAAREQAFFDDQLKAQAEGEATAEAAAEARKAVAIAAYEKALVERAMGTAVTEALEQKELTPEELEAIKKAEKAKQKELEAQAEAMASAAERAAKEQEEWEAALAEAQRQGEATAEAAAAARAERFKAAYEAAKVPDEDDENAELQRIAEAQADEAAKARAERFKRAYAVAIAERKGEAPPDVSSDDSGAGELADAGSDDAGSDDAGSDDDAEGDADDA